ncbi:uncharacterized protein LOC108629616 [Ceratina calcarata]|uniref:Uncharacterized protein LOC108629616 n=1 Tax=Ceratina calcarata TaxID=156304 RepID=A0AAJ7JA23_9HYME|nr:uncharacterized protein LOC108629616 [Ceratina calcarata]
MEKDFAALKLLDSDADWNLTETVDYSKTPSSQRLHIRQTLESEKQFNLVRQFSYEQILDRNESIRQARSLESPRFDSEYRNEAQTTEFFKSPSRQSFKGNNILHAPKFELRRTVSETQCNEVKNAIDTNKVTFRLPSFKSNVPNQCPDGQPKDFDNINNVIKQENVVTNVNKNTYQNVKSKLRPLVAKSKIPAKQKSHMCYYSCLTLFALPIIAMILSLFVNLNVHTICHRATLFSNASQNLQQAIHGQDDSVSKIITHLDQDFFYLKVLCLVGGTGVGKSYTAEIIMKHFPLREEIFTYDLLVDPLSDETSLSSLESFHLIIMENLKLRNLDIFVNVIEKLSKKKDKCITIIAIFNVAEVDDNLKRKIDLAQSTNKIAEALAHKKIDSLIVPYQPLTEDVLEMCIIKAARDSDLKLTSNQINEIKQSLLQSGSGCKGAHAKAQVIGRSADVN